MTTVSYSTVEAMREKVKIDFIKHLLDHPEERLLQALKNYLQVPAVWLQISGEPSDINDERLRDSYED